MHDNHNSVSIMNLTRINKSMFNHFRIVTILILVILAAPNLSFAKKTTLKVGVYDNAPKVFVADDGKPSGIFVDILNEIAASEDWDIEYVTCTWDEGLSLLGKGMIDLMPDVALTPDREAMFMFNKVPVLSSWSQVYAPKGSNIVSILDLNKKRIAVLGGSIQERDIERLTTGFGIETIIIPKDAFDGVFEAVSQGEADAALTNYFYGVLHAPKYGLHDTAIVFSPSTLHFAGKISIDLDIINKLDKHLEKLKADPQSAYYKTIKKWTTEKVKFKIPDWLWLIIIVTAVSFIVSVIWVFILKRRVSIRTQELRIANSEMEIRIQVRTAELEEAMERAKEADRIKSAFLATMSHELRTPLNSIIGFTGILLQELAGKLNDEQKKQMGMVQNSARHLLTLINDILDISKIEARQFDLSISQFDIRDSVEKTINIISPMAVTKGLKVNLICNHCDTVIYTDQRRLEQVLLNLLSNAVKFTEKGKVTLEFKEEEGSYLLIVSDTGIGISRDDLQNIFVPFRQVDTGLSRKYEGTGLGLAITKRIVELMGGIITVDSNIGQGSTFTVMLPKKQGGQNE